MRRTSICTRSVVEGGGVGVARPGVNRQLCHPGCLASQTVRNMSVLSALYPTLVCYTGLSSSCSRKAQTNLVYRKVSSKMTDCLR